jgi:hypothetical protein
VEKPQGVIDLVHIICEIERGHKSFKECREHLIKTVPRERERMLYDHEKTRTMKWIMEEYRKFYGWTDE